MQTINTPIQERSAWLDAHKNKMSAKAYKARHYQLCSEALLRASVTLLEIKLLSGKHNYLLN